MTSYYVTKEMSDPSIGVPCDGGKFIKGAFHEFHKVAEPTPEDYVTAEQVFDNQMVSVKDYYIADKLESLDMGVVADKIARKADQYLIEKNESNKDIISKILKPGDKITIEGEEWTIKTVSVEDWSITLEPKGILNTIKHLIKNII